VIAVGADLPTQPTQGARFAASYLPAGTHALLSASAAATERVTIYGSENFALILIPSINKTDETARN
jgi:hypothetical protein